MNLIILPINAPKVNRPGTPLLLARKDTAFFHGSCFLLKLLNGRSGVSEKLL